MVIYTHSKNYCSFAYFGYLLLCNKRSQNLVPLNIHLLLLMILGVEWVALLLSVVRAEVLGRLGIHWAGPSNMASSQRRSSARSGY